MASGAADHYYDFAVDPLVGKIHTHKQRWEDYYKYVVHMYPAKDVSLQRNLTVVLHVPFDAHIRSEDIGVFLLNSEEQILALVSKNGGLTAPDPDGSVKITMPWLANSKYPVGVWFYSVRSLFRNDLLSRWSTPLSLESSLGADNSSRCQPLSSRINLVAGVGKNKGRRPYMEDVSFQFDFIQTKGDKGVAIYGVLDGHGGGECALYVADELPAKITAHLRSGMEAPEALFNAFLKIDQEFLKIGENVSGSTASVMLWDSYRLRASFANTGDTRAIISRNGVAYDLTIDRKATDHDEISRIVRDGGFVSNGRVQGSLAVSRAFGDRRLKELNKGDKKILVVDPDVSTFQLIPDQDEFIVIATDGLWDVLSSQQVVDFVKANLLTKGLDITQKLRCSNSEIVTSLNEVADSLVKHAIFDLSSGDNVTAMIIVLDNCRNIKLQLSSAAIDAVVGKVGDLSVSLTSSSSSYSSSSSSMTSTTQQSSVFRKDNSSTNSSSSYAGSSIAESGGSNSNLSGISSSSYTTSISATAKVGGLKSSSASSNIATSSSASSSTSQPSKSKSKSETDDDLMDFLMDDANF